MIANRVKRLIGLPENKQLVPSTNGAKAAGSGVSFVGSPNWRTIIRLDTFTDPDAEELTRNIALATSAYAYTAIMYRASRVGEPPLIVTEETDEDGEQQVEGHELEMILDEPSDDYDMGELQQLTEIYRLVTGMCLWVKELDVVGRTARWVPFSGDEFETFAQDGRIYGLFKVDVRGQPRFFLPDEVVFFRDLNPNSWRQGLSRLEVALQHLDLGHQINRTVRNFMRKALFPGGVISPDKEWNPDDDEWEEWKNTIEAWHQGPANAGKPLVVQGGTQVGSVNLGLKDLLPSEVLDRIETVVGSVFGIPPIVLGWKVGLENSPWSQMAEARRMTYEDTIEPRWRDVEKKMTRQILPLDEREAGRKIRFDTSEVRALATDDMVRAQVSAMNAKIWTRNERRAYTDMDPLPDDDERGDEIEGAGMAALLMNNLLNGGDDEEEEEEPPEDDDDDEEEEEEEEASESFLMLVKRLHEKGFVDDKSLEWAMFDFNTKAAEATWERAVYGLLQKMKARILRLADKHLEEKQEVDPDSVVAFVAEVGEFIRETFGKQVTSTTLPLIVSTGSQGLKRAAAQTGLSFTVLEPFLETYAQEEAAFLASVMGETTGAKVAAIVQRELTAGHTIGQMRKALESSAAFTRSRAQLVARTETTRAWNGAQRRSLSLWQSEQEEGTRVVKEWLSARDDRVRPEHVELDGEKVGIDEPFSNGLLEPSEPNCRCTTVYDVVTGG